VSLSKRYPSKRRRADRVARARARCTAVRGYFDASHRAYQGWERLTRDELEPILEQMRGTLAGMGYDPPAEGQNVYFEQGPRETYSATLEDAIRSCSVVTSIDRGAGVITLNGEPIEADRAAGAKILSGVRPEVLRRKSGLELAFEEAASKGLASVPAQRWRDLLWDSWAQIGIMPIRRAVDMSPVGFVEVSDASG